MLEQFDQQTGNFLGTMQKFQKFRMDLYDLVIGSGIPFDALVNIEPIGLNNSNFSRNNMEILGNSKFQNQLVAMYATLFYYRSSFAPEISNLFSETITEIDNSLKK